MLRSRLLRWALLVITAVVVAFWMAFGAVAAAVIATIGTEAAEANPDRVTSIAVPLAVLASVGAVIAIAVVVHARQRSRIHQWLPLYDQMVRDASRPSEHLAQVLTEPAPEAGSHVIATDVVTGARGPLLLPGVHAGRRPHSLLWSIRSREGTPAGDLCRLATSQRCRLSSDRPSEADETPGACSGEPSVLLLCAADASAQPVEVERGAAGAQGRENGVLVAPVSFVENHRDSLARDDHDTVGVTDDKVTSADGDTAEPDGDTELAGDALAGTAYAVVPGEHWELAGA
jgi:hypothetical protein